MEPPVSDLQLADVDDILGDAFTIDRTLGQGAMATVFLARDQKHQRPVALKVIDPRHGARVGRERFLREIRIAAQLVHPHIVPIYDSGATGSLLWYTMPYIEGPSLRHRIFATGAFPVDEALEITRSVAKALDYAHRHGVVHRDVKPDNILLQEGQALLADFGVAKRLTFEGGEMLTVEGTTVGTPTYMSPEQAAGETVIDGRSDIYSLGCVLFEMLSGVPPFIGSTSRSIIGQHLTSRPPSLVRFRDDIDPYLDEIVARALAKAPAHRFATASDFIQVLAGDRRATPRSSARQSSQASVAVLPFANLGADPENEYFADGMTDEIITALSRTRRLRVAARSSSFTFKGKPAPLSEIAATLNAATILEGSVRRSGERVRIAISLVDAASGHHLWSERYDRSISDVFAIQDEIAKAVADALLVRTSSGEHQVRSHPYTPDLEAYQLYLKGRFFWNQRGAGLKKGMDCFQRSLELDPTYPLPYAGLADAYNMLGVYQVLPPNVAYPNAKTAALKALSLDEALPEAWTALALLCFCYEWDRAGADEAFARALRLDGRYVPALTWKAASLGAVRAFDECFKMCRDALEIDPLSVQAHSVYGWFLVYAQRYDEAISRFAQAIELNPTFAFAHQYVGLAQLEMGQRGAALRSLERAVAVSDGAAWQQAMLAYAHGTLGHREEAERTLAQLTERATREFVPAWSLAAIHASLGQIDRAFEALDRAIVTRELYALSLGVEPLWRSLREDPRFAPLVARTSLTRG